MKLISTNISYLDLDFWSESDLYLDEKVEKIFTQVLQLFIDNVQILSSSLKADLFYAVKWVFLSEQTNPSYFIKL